MNITLVILLLLTLIPAHAIKMDDYRLSQNVERQVDPGWKWVKANCPSCEKLELDEAIVPLSEIGMRKKSSHVYVIPNRELIIAFSNMSADQFKLNIEDRADAEAGPFCHDIFPGFRTIKKSHRYYPRIAARSGNYLMAFKTMDCKRINDIPLKKIINYLKGKDPAFD